MTEASVAAAERLDALHILIVDDDAAFLTLVEAILKSFGIRKITKAASGREVYNIFRGQIDVVDCIISDYSMDEGNGLQLLQVIRTGQMPNARADIAFVLLTLSGDEKTVLTARQLDVSSYLVKPVTPPRLKEAIIKARSRAFRLDIDRYKQVLIPV